MEMTEAVEHFPGGPIDPTILKSFESHIAHTIWTSVEDDRGPLKCISHWSKLNDWNLEEECAAVRTRVRESGLLNLAKYSYKHIDRVLVSAFIERWHPETNSFHLPFGEMTITLDDVRHILDIPVDGVPVYGELGASNMAFEVALDLVCRGLGVSKAQAQTEMEKAFAIKLSWIKSVCSGTTENSTPERHDQCARGYLLYLLGCTVFPDKTGNKISAYYLQSLMDLDGVHNLAWGMGVLAHLYRQMGLATRSGVRQISGNLTLLQAWIFEHFSLGRPIPNRDYNEKMPRMRRWHIQLSPRDTDSTLVSIREQLDDLSPNEAHKRKSTCKNGASQKLVVNCDKVLGMNRLGVTGAISLDTPLQSKVLGMNRLGVTGAVSQLVLDTPLQSKEVAGKSVRMSHQVWKGKLNNGMGWQVELMQLLCAKSDCLMPIFVASCHRYEHLSVVPEPDGRS